SSHRGQICAVSLPALWGAAQYGSFGTLSSFHDHRDPLAPADAQSREPAARSAASHFVQQCYQHSRTARPDGMAERACAAIDIHPGGIEAQFADYSQALRRERLVELEQVYVAGTQPCFFQSASDRGNGSQAHVSRIDARAGIRDDLRQRSELHQPRSLTARYHESCRSIVQPRSVGRGDPPRLRLKRRTQSGQLVQSRVGARMLVGLEKQGLTLSLRNRNGNDLIHKSAGAYSSCRPALALDGKLVLLLAGYAESGCDVLSSNAHVTSRDGTGES